MIFEVDYSVIKRHLTTIKNMMTDTEWRNPEYNTIELHVDDDKVFISYQGVNQSKFDYQFDLIKAEAILNGSVRLNIKELIEALKTFNKDSGNLLIERDGNELIIDDGVYEPELIILDDHNELEKVFTVAYPKECISLPKEWLLNRMEIARINSRSTFLPATSQVAMVIQDDSVHLRSFNLTNLHNSSINIKHSFQDAVILIDKGITSRMSRILKSISNNEVKFFANNKSLYLFTDEFVFRFDVDSNEQDKKIYEILPVKEMAKSEEQLSYEISKLQSLTKVKIGEETPLAIGVEWNGEKSILNICHDVEDTSFIYYPFKEVQKVASKWKESLSVEKGVEENEHPLILKHRNDNEEDIFVIMRMEEKV